MKQKLSPFVGIRTLLIVTSLVIAGCSDGSDDDDNEQFTGGGVSDAGSSDVGTTDVGTTDEGSIDDGDDGDDDAEQETLNTDGTSDFEVPLSGELQVPALDLPDAEATANLTIDKTSGAIAGSVIPVGLTSAVTAAHIHTGYAGRNGPPIITLESNNGNILTIPAGAGLDASQLTDLDNGALYINVHTSDNPSGEIRGQIIPNHVLLEDTELSGEEVAPAVVTSASGEGFSTLNTESGAISITVFIDGLDDAVSAEIRMGAAGINGTTILSLVQDATNPEIWRSGVDATLTEAQMEAFEDEGLYVVITSTEFSDGEIRGQL